MDEGWGRRAVDFATLLEPAACREYVAMHHHLDVGEGDQLLDIACGPGLAMELAAVRGAVVSGIDASPRLIEVARHRLPDSDVRVGDMTSLPWADASFDVVTSFRWSVGNDHRGAGRGPSGAPPRRPDLGDDVGAREGVTGLLGADAVQPRA